MCRCVCMYVTNTLVGPDYHNCHELSVPVVPPGGQSLPQHLLDEFAQNVHTVSNKRKQPKAGSQQNIFI